MTAEQYDEMKWQFVVFKNIVDHYGEAMSENQFYDIYLEMFYNCHQHLQDRSLCLLHCYYPCGDLMWQIKAISLLTVMQLKFQKQQEGRQKR